MGRIVTYRQRDLAAALRAVAATGTKAKSVKIDRQGTIVIELGEEAEPIEQPSGGGWESVRHKI